MSSEPRRQGTGPGARMRAEIAEIPEAAARLSRAGEQAAIGAAAARLRDLDPPALVTVARGSSDHAATYLKYAVEITLGRPVASMGPSVASVYGAALRARGLAALAVSQSGASEDIVGLARALGAGGAEVLALTNTAESPLAAAADAVLPVAAGPERAVAATKSYVNSVLAGLWLVARWAGDGGLARALDAAPARLAEAADGAPPGLAAALGEAGEAVVLARGPGLGVAGEVSLKLAETCRIHATALSAAEALHGPSALMTGGFPVLALAGGARDGHAQAVARLRAQGAKVWVLPRRAAGHLLLEPLLELPGLYAMIEALARARGVDPDAPEHLSKVTRTR